MAPILQAIGMSGVMFQTAVCNDAGDVRRVLLAMRAQLSGRVENSLIDLAETVLAEILNNIVEHALTGLGQAGSASVECRGHQGGLAFRVCDNGRAMPGGVLPTGQLPDIGNDRDQLPEGGFGWGMVHILAKELRYRRVAGENHLTFSVPARCD